MLSVLQVGANAHSKAVAFSHDPVPRLIARGFSAVLVEPQPFAAESLRKAYAHNSLVRVVQAAFCPDASATTVPLWFINGTKNLGSNESDVRCAGAAISGTASFSRAHVMQHQRFYKFTPSQCANCARELGRALPPTCMRQLYSANLEVANVPCARPEHILPTARAISSSSSGGGGGGSNMVDVLVVDVEGEDDRVVARYLELAGGVPPYVLVYEHVHLRKPRKAALVARLERAGMRPYVHAAMREPPAHELPARAWSMLRHHLARVSPKDNTVWVLNSSARS